jgi:predicted hydrocarbon binding protein
MRYPKDVEIWEHAPGRKIAEVVVRLKNSKGALARCSQVINESEVNILTGFFTAPAKSQTATLSFFADITDAREGLSGLKRALLGVDVVASVDAIAADDGFMVDRQHFPVQWAGRRAVVVRAEALNEMLNRLWTVFGTGAATIIDQMAEAMGRHSAREIVEDFGREFAMSQLEELLSTYSALGYADISVERESSDFPVVVDARELFECDANARLSLRRRSTFFRAHLRGFMAGVFDRGFEVSEVQCRTDGDDVCSFRVDLSEATTAGVTAVLPERGPRASNL